MATFLKLYIVGLKVAQAWGQVSVSGMLVITVHSMLPLPTGAPATYMGTHTAPWVLQWLHTRLNQWPQPLQVQRQGF